MTIEKVEPIPTDLKHLSLADGLRRFEDERREAGRLLAKKQADKEKSWLFLHPNASLAFSKVRFSNPKERAKFDYGIGGG